MNKAKPFTVVESKSKMCWTWDDQSPHTYIWQLAPSGILIVSKRSRNTTFKVDLDDEPVKVYAPGSWKTVEVTEGNEDVYGCDLDYDE